MPEGASVGSLAGLRNAKYTQRLLSSSTIWQIPTGSEPYPSVPRITANVQNVTSEAIASASSAYIASANEYAAKYVETVELRDYVTDRLMKDMAENVGVLAKEGINLESNTIALHVKADDLYAQASRNVSLNSVNAVSTVVANFSSLYDTYYVESGSGVLDIADSCYASPVQYDKMAVKIDSAVATVVESSVFIKDVPNAIGTACTYTNYASSTSGYEPQFTISHVSQISSGVTSAGWVITEAGQSNALAYTESEKLNGKVTWTEVQQ